MNEQRIALFHLDTFDTGTHTCVVCTDILDQCLKLAVTVFRTRGTIFRMSGKQQFQSQGTQFVDPLTCGMYYHSVLCTQGTGCGHAFLTFDFYNTHAAGTILRQIRMMAEVRNINSGFQRTFQYIFILRHFQAGAVNRNDCHVFSPFCSSFNLCRFDVHSVLITSDIFLTCTVLLWYTVTIITDKIIT